MDRILKRFDGINEALEAGRYFLWRTLEAIRGGMKV